MMIDVSALGLSAVQTPQQAGKHKSGTADEHGKNAKSFGDFVKAAGSKDDHDDATDDATTGKTAAKRGVPAFDIDAKNIKTAATTDATVTDSGSEMAEATDAQVTSALEAQTETSLSDSIAQLLTGEMQVDSTATGKSDAKSAKTEKADGTADQPAGKDNSPLHSAKVFSDPAKELRAMLGEARDADDDDDGTVAKADEKLAKRDANDDLVANAAEISADIDTADGTAVTAKTDGTAVAQVAAQHTIAAATAQSKASAVEDAADAKQSTADTAAVTLVSNDGKARAVDAALAETTSGDEAQTAGDKTDFVTVLEARRYLGFTSDAAAAGNTGANANALTDAIKSDPSWAQVIQAAKSGSQSTATEVNTLKLQMNPEHLGNMTASLRLKGEELSVEVRVETVDAYRQLSQDQDGIVKALKDQGFSIDNVSIQLSPSARSDGGQMGSNQNQSGNGHNLQDGSQGDTARQRDESARRNANQNNWTGNDRTATLGDTGSSTDDSRSGNLYL